MRWFIVSLIGGIALFFYFYAHHSEAFKAYAHFDNVRREGNCTELKHLVQGPAQAWLDGFCGGGNSGGGDVLGGLGAAAAGPDSAYATASGASGLSALLDAAGVTFAHKPVSETENDDGSITVVADCIPLDTHNDPSLRKIMPSKHRHTVRLKPQGDGFVVVDFQDRVAND
jgi:hypothetical protein